jgi:uncharacterized Zn finger protein
MESLKFNACPNCGSEETVSRVLSKEGQEKGNLTKEQSIALFGIQTIVADPSKQQKIIVSKREVPAVSCVFDVCSKCGTLFATTVSIQNVVLQNPEANQKPGQLFRN